MMSQSALPLSYQAILLLVAGNVFMTFAWYGHLKNSAAAPWNRAVLVSRVITPFEYLRQVPGNRIGYQQAGFTLGQFKIVR